MFPQTNLFQSDECFDQPPLKKKNSTKLTHAFTKGQKNGYQNFNDEEMMETDQNEMMEINEHIDEGTSKTKGSFRCPICQDNQPIRKQKLFDDCGHKFCESCMVYHVKEKLRRFQKIVCPEEGCRQVLNQDSFLLLYLSQKQKSQFKRIANFYKAAENPNIKNCAQCEGIIYAPSVGDKSTCINCSKVFCWKCLFPSHEGQCESNEINFMSEHFKYQQCGNCKIIVENIGSCYKMTCKCQYNFCYKCGEQWGSSHKCQIDVKNQQLQKERRKKERMIKEIILGAFFGGLVLLLVIFDFLSASSESICVILPINSRKPQTLKQWFFVNGVAGAILLFFLPFLLCFYCNKRKAQIFGLGGMTVLTGFKVLWVFFGAYMSWGENLYQELNCSWSASLIYIRTYTTLIIGFILLFLYKSAPC